MRWHCLRMCKAAFYLLWVVATTCLSACQTSNGALANLPAIDDSSLPDLAGEKDSESAKNLADDGVDIEHRYSYKVRGQSYQVFKNAKRFQEIGTASWYGPGFHGKKTASGEIYDMYALTAAHRTLPLGSFITVTNLENQKKITVRVNDRGPFHDDRVIDLSKKAAETLGILGKGFARVHIRALPPDTKPFTHVKP